MKSTKELARELGLLKKRKHVNRLSEISSTVQPFTFLIVIDFESTCWENAKYKSQEIIEFPAVLLNTQNGEIESEFHHYVQPQEQPTLSSFCTGLTGITQDQVDNGIPINLCLRRFCHWLNKLHTEKGIICHGTVNDSSTPVNTTCVTWSDWDLGVCLQYECKRKQLLKPVQLNVWIDLRATYRRFYDRKPNGLNGALQDLGIVFQGREHSGVDDARNTAKLAYRMIRDGCVLKNTRNMKGHTRSMSLPTSILLPDRKTPPRKAKEKKCSTNIPISKTETPKKETDGYRNCFGGNFIFVNNSSKVIDEPRFLSKGVVTIRRTPPRKAKGKTNVQNSSNIVDSDAEVMCKINGVTADVEAVGTAATKTSKANSNDTNCDCEDVCLCHDLELFLADCDNISTSSLGKTKISHKRKILSSEKRDISSVNSPARKLPRRISPTKFSLADIFVDTEEVTGNCRILMPITSDGLKLQDTNITGNTDKPSHIGKHDSDCFKKPNAFFGKSSLSSPNRNSSFQQKVLDSSRSGAQIKLSGQSNLSTSVGRSVNRSSSLSATTPRGGSENSSGLKTPFQTPSCSSTKSISMRNCSASSMKITPPLCKCGRRSKRRIVQSPGQNMGRFFFSCSVRKRVGSKEGCDFFKWESSVSYNTPLANGSAAIMKQFVTPLSRSNVSKNPTVSQKRSLGIKSNLSQSVCMR